MSECSHCMGTCCRLVPNKFGEASMSNDMCHYCGGRGKIEQDEPSDIDIMNDLQRQLDQLKAENERLKARAESAEKALWNIVYFVPSVGERDYSDKLIRIAETAVGIERY